MPNRLSTDYRGLDLAAIAQSLDDLFGFPSDWNSVSGSGQGCWEYNGRIVVDLDSIDKLCDLADAGPGDIGHVFRYALAHLKAHHYQELHPSYDKTYLEDIRPYELDADLTAGWVCANAQIANSFRAEGTTGFADFGRSQLIQGADEPTMAEVSQYPWPEERAIAFSRGARMWAAGRISEYNSAGSRQGIRDETFQEFLAEVPTIVQGMWNRPIPQAASVI